MNTLLEQLKKGRIALGYKQKDMMLRIGISRQQYQRLESKGNPRLDTLELIAKGLKSELMLIPQEKLGIVKAALEDDAISSKGAKKADESNTLSKDPWKDILRSDE